MNIEIRQYGIILTVIGTILLAFSVRILAGHNDNKVLKEWHKDARESGYIWPSETYINKWLFWGGLSCIGKGALLQW